MNLIRNSLILVLFLNFFVLKAVADEWDDITPEGMGISREEYQKVRQSGMSKAKFLKLMEVGISPNEYFSEPWKKLGVSESHWLSEKGAGMADDDINNTFHRQSTNNLVPLVSFILPGYYEYHNNKFYMGLTQSLVAGLGLLLTVSDQNNDTKGVNPVYPLITLGAMLWSGADAYMGTRYLDNQDAGKFTLNLGLDRTGGPQALLSLRF